MSDRETNDDELSLPKATVQKLISGKSRGDDISVKADFVEMLPSDITCAKDTRDLLIDCCVEFIHLVASESNDICEKDAKKTIAPEHVVTALEQLGYTDYIEEIQDVLKEHKQQQKDREKKQTRLEKSGLSTEELLQQQEMLFQQSRMKFQQGTGPSNGNGNGTGSS